MSAQEDVPEYLEDEWPSMSDGNDYDGEELLDLVRSGHSPFKDGWDVNLLINEVEAILHAKVVDIPMVTRGSNNYGIHLTVQDRTDVVVRLARGDVNMPGFGGFSLDRQVGDIKFEAATYDLLSSEPGILAARLLYCRPPVQHAGPRVERPTDILGRRMMVFERTEGANNVFGELNDEEQVSARGKGGSV